MTGDGWSFAQDGASEWCSNGAVGWRFAFRMGNMGSMGIIGLASAGLRRKLYYLFTFSLQKSAGEVFPGWRMLWADSWALGLANDLFPLNPVPWQNAGQGEAGALNVALLLVRVAATERTIKRAIAHVLVVFQKELLQWEMYFPCDG